MSRQLEERQVRAIYESIDTGSYKAAVQQANKLLKRQPGNVLYKALKVLALARTGRPDDEAEAHGLLDEVILSRPKDESVLGVTSHALKALNRPFDSITLFEEAFKQAPHDEELGSQAFMANIRVGNWKPAQLLATRMFKNFGKDRMLWWAVMCAVLQSMYANAQLTASSSLSTATATKISAASAAMKQPAGDKDRTDVRNLLLNLALRLIERAPETTHANADRFALHLDILQALERADEALVMLDTEHGKHLVRTSPVVQEIRRELILRTAAWDKERAATEEAMQFVDRSWEHVLSNINSHLYSVVAPSIDTIPIIDPGLPGPLPPWPAPPVPEDKREALLAAAQECKKYFDAMIVQDGEAGKDERTGWLALLELERRVRAYDLGGRETEGVIDVPELLEGYVKAFGGKAVCVEDVLGHAELLDEAGKERLRASAEATATELETDVASITSTSVLQRLITALKLSRAFAAVPRTAEQEVTDAKRYAAAYFAALPLGKDIPKTEIQPADDLAVLAAQALVGAHAASQDQAYLYAAAALLETACSASRYAYGLRLCLVRVYRMLGAGKLALKHYRLLGAKLVQTDTLSHFVLARGSMFSLASNGDLDYLAEATEAGVIYVSNTAETPEMLVRAFQWEKYSQVTDFMTFQDRLECSLQRDLTLVELARMRILHTGPRAGAITDAELVDMKGFFDRIVSDRYDNRDLGVLPSLQPIAGDSFDKQTTLGPVAPAGGWANAFLKVYLRTFVNPLELDRQQDPEVLKKLGVELPTHDEPLSERVKHLTDEELSELTEEERALVDAVDELLSWVERHQTKEAANGNGHGNGHAEGGDKDVVERIAKGFEDAQARIEALAADPDGSLAWKILHASTLLHERFVLFSLVSSSVTSKNASKKKTDPLAQGVRTIRTRGTAALKAVCAALTARAEREDAATLVERCKDVLGDAVEVGATMDVLAASRREAFEGLAHGIARVSLS
ncbi:hypothetical protein EXIGLDRAFT_720622 [Exidia glandulosa HHB12029]|uniref:Actin cytoskeleton organization protein n=1 Tax=Exidia glandulosa HHB12029 TaxID=1314781 RepID=A0A165G8D4_EXIGL|nr:hypothetical protein EXIGLDRAFT_720622 [Exidia glandulosa HHB12029]